MLDSLFEGSAFKMFLVRWFGRERPTNAGRRGRQARLAVVDAANVDGRRKLVLIRRDNLEHLVLIGGPSDVLIEPNIAAGAAPREVPPPRPVPTGDTLRRAVPLGEGKHVAAAARTGAETGTAASPRTAAGATVAACD
jgi:flagellar protein FliO/FliZ